ncbi:hypothetical protein EZV62_008165 [Acer yangbiense]|uniref:Uncharacterized protein n=1 Tax=Acer yangbiense TaxID=1000413 RepID=A0A5C7IC26_9ROSI|nr:hypothetical protein EZV62_008165 [Acer yangbiense]
MQVNTSSDDATATTPLLEKDRNGGGDGGWWGKVLVLDVEEAKNQVLFSLTMILTNAFYNAIPLVSVMFAGHLGHLQPGATLANSWATVTGFAFMGGSYIFELDNYSDLNVCRGILDYKSICLFLEEEKDVYCFLANKISAFYCFFCFHEAITDAVLSVQIHPELGAFDQLEQNATNAKIPFYERYGMF